MFNRPMPQSELDWELQDCRKRLEIAKMDLRFNPNSNRCKFEVEEWKKIVAAIEKRHKLETTNMEANQ
jgi:hypothetical protein